MNKQEIAERWPEAVAIARQFRDVFGDGVRLTYAKDKATGAELGKRDAQRLAERQPAKEQVGASSALWGMTKRY